jgi:hypothetical protein
MPLDTLEFWVLEAMKYSQKHSDNIEEMFENQ